MIKKRKSFNTDAIHSLFYTYLLTRHKFNKTLKSTHIGVYNTHIGSYLGFVDMLKTSIGDALFTKTQQQVLGLLYGKPKQSFYTNEIVRLADMGRGTITRELEKLVSVDLIVMTRTGNQNHYQANPLCPIYDELLGIVRKTFGLADVIKYALKPVSEQIDFSFIYGSIARGEESAGSDIDLLVVSESLAYADMMNVLEDAEKSLGRPINPSIYMSEQIQSKLKQKNAFLTKVMEQPKLWVKGSDDDIREFRKPSKN
ncbi:MAG: nucleotidyltransferase domain-containing protein [Thiohalomonadales bacterium]